MVQVMHEVWRGENSYEFGRPNARADALRAKLEPEAKRVHVIYAASLNEAMTRYYEWQGWGLYRLPEGFDDVAYTEEDLREVEAVRPQG